LLVCRDILQSQRTFAFLCPHLAEAQQARQPPVTFAVDGIGEQARGIDKVEPTADQRFQAHRLGRTVQPYHPGECVAVGDADRIHAETERSKH
jgi:hypothetical protein